MASLPRRPPARSAPRRAQSGVVLFVSLVLLLVLTLLGVTVARMQTGEERMAQNDTNHQLALQAADAALRFAESGLMQGIYVNFQADTAGLYQLVPAAGSVVDTINWNSPGAAVLTYTGPAIAAVHLSAPPVFVIENLPAVAPPGPQTNYEGYASTTPPVVVYRVTAHGYGGDTTSGVTLQSIFR